MRKFIGKIFKVIKGGAQELYGVKDVFGNPTHTLDFAKTIKNFVEGQPEYGIYHASGRGIASRCDVLREFIRLLGVPVLVVPVTREEYYKLFPSRYLPTRSEALLTDKIEGHGLSEMRDWQEALKDYVREFK